MGGAGGFGRRCFTFGDARFFGGTAGYSACTVPSASPNLGATGWWVRRRLPASAEPRAFHGGTAVSLNKPIVGIPTPDGRGTGWWPQTVAVSSPSVTQPSTAVPAASASRAHRRHGRRLVAGCGYWLVGSGCGVFSSSVNRWPSTAVPAASTLTTHRLHRPTDAGWRTGGSPPTAASSTTDASVYRAMHLNSPVAADWVSPSR